MCGIIGLASSEGTKGHLKRRGFLYNGLYADALRGFHSTGIACVPEKIDEEILIHKKAIPAADFLETAVTERILKDTDRFKFVIGHNRHATKGGLTSRMAHPFTHGDITLVHNGTLTTQHNLPKGSSFISDSEAITYAINEQGSEKTIESLNGAFALVWHDGTDDTLHMVRNEERPLAFAFVKDENTMLFGSEVDMVMWIAARNGIEIEEAFTLGKGYEAVFDSDDLRKYKTHKRDLYVPIYSRNYGTNYYSNRSGGNNFSKSNTSSNGSASVQKEEAFKSLGVESGKDYDIEVTEFVPFNSNQKSGTRFGFLEGRFAGNKGNHRVKVVGVSELDWLWLFEEYPDEEKFVTARLTKACEVIGNNKFPTFTSVDPTISNLNEFMNTSDDDDITSTYEGPRGTFCTKEEFDIYVKDGCANCSSPIDAEDHEKVKWTATNAPICETCQGLSDLGVNIIH